MAPISSKLNLLQELSKRDSSSNCYYYGYNCSSSWVWARWILFVILIVGLLGIVVSAVRINKRRMSSGRNPIIGTAWITPPSYSQAQRNQQQNPPYVPEYSAEANVNDAGYYDNEGKFHPNLKGAYTGNAVHLDNIVPDQTGVSQPTSTYQPTGNDPHENFSRDFSRYYQGVSSNNGNSSEPINQEVYSRPQGPPPTAHLKN
ncbi:hypothetical protein WICMUC_000501 [Wickerhamomyces mucosus]|uniref:Protein RCR2 n=1 Tax=Wickerhamomyces mucosus TaxID=1378264 RepID=A0A9P8PZ20_9ASCO|nr:hypothetical protein WICMUC_000501 [Wickerhamomyces mucosus]